MKAPKPTERQVQRGVISLVNAEFNAQVNHVPNQAPVSDKVFFGVRKGDGVVTGWPDLQVRWAPGKMAFLEVKRPGEKARPDQAALHDVLRADGFFVAVVTSIDEARAALKEAGVPTRGQRLTTGAMLLNRAVSP